jgi:hypothetical protein
MKITKSQLRQIIEEEINALDEGRGEGYMAVSQLEYMKEIIPKIQQYVNDASDLEEWVESKITLAHEYIETVYGHFEGTDKPKVGGRMGLYMADVLEEEEELDEKIEKTKDGEYYATSKGGRRLSKKPKTKKAALKQLAAVEASKAERGK